MSCDLAICKAIRVEMARNRLTQRKTAERAGIAPSAFVLKLGGHRDFSHREVQRLAEVFNISYSEFARRIERENEEPAAAATATGR